MNSFSRRAAGQHARFPACLVAAFAAVTATPGGAQPARAPEPPTLLYAGTLIAVPGQPVRREVTIVIRDARIERIAAGYLAPAAVGGDDMSQVVDLRDRVVLPGLMDAHVHLDTATGAFGPNPFSARARQARETDAAVNAVVNAQLSLAAGFTTLRDLGSVGSSVFAARDAINAGKLLGPTIIAAGPVIHATGGSNRGTDSLDPDERAANGTCDGVDECRRLVRVLHKRGAELIKFRSTGGFSDQSGTGQTMFRDEMQALVDTAHQLGMKITTHGYEATALKQAIEAGVDSIEHGWLLDDPTIRLMQKSGVVLVPTVTVARPPSISLRFMKPGTEPSSVTMRNKFAAFEKAYRAGVRIAFGTDCGIYPHGRNADEFVTMVNLGMTPMDAIRSATVNTAELFGIAADAGTLEPGKRADIIAVTADPLADIAALQQVDFVMKSGRVLKRDGRMTAPVRFDLEHEY